MVVVLSIVLLCTALVVPFVQHLSKAHAAPERARSTDAFVDTIGVNTHLTYSNTIYSNYNNIIKPRLLELGARHIRDGNVVGNTGYFAQLKELAANGIHVNLISDPRTLTPQQAVNTVSQLGSGVVESVEGPNEYDNSQDPNKNSTIQTYMQQLHAGLKGNSATANLPIIGPSGVSADGYKNYGDLSGYVDYCNMHNYHGGRQPELPAGGLDGQGYGTIGNNMKIAQVDCGGKPVMSTETGYTNSGNNQAIPERASGAYMPRQYLYAFNNGVPHTYNYEFINEGNDANNPEANFGLLRNDGSEKPAFVAMKNMINLLKETGANFTPGSLDYSLSGNTANVNHTLLEKSDGTFYLALWVGASRYNTDNQQSTSVASQQVTLNLNQPTSGATLYTLSDTGDMASAPATINNNQMNLNVADTVTVVKLSSANVPINAPTSPATGTSGVATFSNKGISDDGNTAAANYDSWGSSYSAQALKSVGIVAGQGVSYNGANLTWPSVTPGQTDNYLANGQTLGVSAGSGAKTLTFLCSSTNGPSTGTATIIYSDTTRQTFDLGCSDWTLNAGSSSPSYENGIVTTMSYRNNRSSRENVSTYVFYADVALQSGKTVQSVVLPATVNQGHIHIFAVGTK